MATGSVPLLEAVKWGSDPTAQGVAETLIQESPIMEMQPWMAFSGNALQVRIEDTLPGTAFRKVNDTYTRTYGTDRTEFYGVAILGGEIFVDNFEVRVAADQIDLKARQFQKMAKSMARTYDKYWFDGTGTADDFKGAKALVAEGLGQAVINSTNGAALTLDKLDQLLDALRTQTPSALLMNRTMRRKITSLARTTVTGISLIDVGTDVFGRQVYQYNGVPIRIIGDDGSGTAILPFTETEGSGTVNTSIWAVDFADDGVHGLAGAGGQWEVSDFGETEAAPGHLGRVEAYPGLCVRNPLSLARLSGITNA